MGKTYRNAPHDFSEWGDGKHRKRTIKSVDRKHGKVRVNDGAYASELEDGFISNGKKTVECGYGVYVKPAAKRVAKKLKSKFERKLNNDEE